MKNKRNKKVKKMSNKKIPSHIALGVVGLLSLVLIAVAFSGLKDVEKLNGDMVGSRSKAKQASEKKCEIHAYQGEAIVGAWIDKDKGEVTVSNEDLSMLPGSIKQDRSVKVKIVDLDDEAKGRLENASPQQPEKIRITGFATKCGELNLASLNYHDGIFRSYLNK